MTQKNFGNWKYERLLGSGGFGRVELWKERYTDKRIAIKKCMLAESDITPKQRERWKQEIENIENFNHPNIVKSEPVPEEMKLALPNILCMEFCNKGDLRKVLSMPENACGLVERDVVNLMKDISSALKYLHSKHITHRDLKPDNIVLHETNELVTYKLIDLGFAKDLGNKTTTASLVGTFNYVAPELIFAQKYTCSVDYWSLGIFFFEVLTGYKPFIPHTEIEDIKKWVDTMSSKPYKDICAKEINGDIQFYDYVIYPNDLSECTLITLVEWFRVVLQWNPRTRGKRQDRDEIVVFPLLKEIFSWDTISIFSVSLYRIDKFNVNSKTTLKKLQKWIEQKTDIPINVQIIADIKGKVLNKMKNSENLPLGNIPDSILYVYKSKCEKISENENSKLPEILDLMFVEPNAIQNRSMLRQCYTALIYVMRHEIMLFKQFTLALGTRLDIIIARLIVLENNIQKSLPNLELLLNDANEVPKMTESKTTSTSDVMELIDKIKQVDMIINSLKKEVEISKCSSCNIKKFFDSEKLLCDLQKFSKCYEDFLKMFRMFENEKTYHIDFSDHVNRLTDILLQFDEQKMILLQDENTSAIISQLVQLETNLYSHLEVTNSCKELIPFYKANLSKLMNVYNKSINCTSNAAMMPQNHVPNVNLSIVTNDDKEIKDNVVLRAVFHQRLQEFQKDWSQYK